MMEGTISVPKREAFVASPESRAATLLVGYRAARRAHKAATQALREFAVECGLPQDEANQMDVISFVDGWLTARGQRPAYREDADA